MAVDGDAIWVVLQRELKGDPKGVARIGRYMNGRWEWFGYQLESTDAKGDWIGLSEIVVHEDGLLVLELDRLNGPDAAMKAIYRVEIPTGDGATEAGKAPEVLPKKLARDAAGSASDQRFRPGEGRGCHRRG